MVTPASTFDAKNTNVDIGSKIVLYYRSSIFISPYADQREVCGRLRPRTKHTRHARGRAAEIRCFRCHQVARRGSSPLGPTDVSHDFVVATPLLDGPSSKERPEV